MSKLRLPPSRAKRKSRECLGDASGATAIEYGLIAALIAVVIIAGAGTLGNSLKNKFNTIATSVTSAGR